MRGSCSLVALALCWLVCVGQALAEVPVPHLEKRITDLTGTLTPAQQTELENRLAVFEQKKGSQVAVLIVPTTQPEDIAQYSIRVAEQWKLGRKGVDDGALLLVAKNDRKLRIEVGYGLEGALNDATAKRIIEEFIVPRFRAGDFAGGITAGIDRVLGVIDGEPLPAPKAHAGGPQATESLLALPFFAAVFASALLRSLFGPFAGGLVAGGLIGGLAWLLGVGIFFSILLGLFAFVLTLAGNMTSGSGYSSGGGSFGGGGFGGGGFSGGGGGFGGGGASGRW